jgi:hypothetical protein
MEGELTVDNCPRTGGVVPAGGGVVGMIVGVEVAGGEVGGSVAGAEVLATAGAVVRGTREVSGPQADKASKRTNPMINSLRLTEVINYSIPKKMDKKHYFMPPGSPQKGGTAYRRERRRGSSRRRRQTISRFL